MLSLAAERIILIGEHIYILSHVWGSTTGIELVLHALEESSIEVRTQDKAYRL